MSLEALRRELDGEIDASDKANEMQPRIGTGVLREWRATISAELAEQPDGETVHDVARTLVRLARPGEDRAEVVEQLERIPLFAEALDQGEDPDGDGHPTIREFAREGS